MNGAKMNYFKQAVATFLCFVLVSTLAWGGNSTGNTFTKVRYNGGAGASQSDPKDWDNKLTVSSDVILLELKGEKKSVDRVEIPSKSVTGLSYGQEAHRRVGTM